MRPPDCAICDANALDEGGGRVSFALDEQAKDWHDRANLEPGFVGHPPEQEWFCSAHIQAARALAHLPLSDAMRALAC